MAKETKEVKKIVKEWVDGKPKEETPEIVDSTYIVVKDPNA